jgi:hypothetical protein
MEVTIILLLILGNGVLAMSELAIVVVIRNRRPSRSPVECLD